MRTTVFALGLALVGCGNDKRDESGLGDGGSTYEDAAVDMGPPIDTLPCGQLYVTYRDFNAAHPDFEGTIADDLGIVQTMLGTDKKPVYANGAHPTVQSKMTFDQWYNDVAGVNQKVSDVITLTENPPGTFTYDNSSFFPVDGKGFNEQSSAPPHNFHFTTEIHTRFTYKGGEVFTFTGDDDVFIFINNRLALDLGGVHGAQSQTIDFDAQAATLGLTTGMDYDFDAFHAERHTSESNFRMSTTIECFVIF